MQKTCLHFQRTFQGFVNIHEANLFGRKGKIKTSSGAAMGNDQSRFDESLKNLGQMSLRNLQNFRHFFYGNPFFSASQKSHTMQTERSSFGKMEKAMHVFTLLAI